MIVKRGTTDGDVDAEDTTEGVHTTEGVGFGKPNPPLVDHRCFAPQVFFTYHSIILDFFMYWDNCISFLWGWGK